MPSFQNCCWENPTIFLSVLFFLLLFNFPFVHSLCFFYANYIHSFWWIFYEVLCECGWFHSFYYKYANIWQITRAARKKKNDENNLISFIPTMTTTTLHMYKDFRIKNTNFIVKKLFLESLARVTWWDPARQEVTTKNWKIIIHGTHMLQMS